MLMTEFQADEQDQVIASLEASVDAERGALSMQDCLTIWPLAYDEANEYGSLTMNNTDLRLFSCLADLVVIRTAARLSSIWGDLERHKEYADIIRPLSSHDAVFIND